MQAWVELICLGRARGRKKKKEKKEKGKKETKKKKACPVGTGFGSDVNGKNDRGEREVWCGVVWCAGRRVWERLRESGEKRHGAKTWVFLCRSPGARG